MSQASKKIYTRPQRPQLKVIGSVADLTQTGLTNGGDDAKMGSRPSAGI